MFRSESGVLECLGSDLGLDRTAGFGDTFSKQPAPYKSCGSAALEDTRGK